MLIDEAAMFFLSLDRADLEAIVVAILEEACRRGAAAKALGNVLPFRPVGPSARIAH